MFFFFKKVNFPTMPNSWYIWYRNFHKKTKISNLVTYSSYQTSFQTYLGPDSYFTIRSAGRVAKISHNQKLCSQEHLFQEAEDIFNCGKSSKLMKNWLILFDILLFVALHFNNFSFQGFERKNFMLCWESDKKIFEFCIQLYSYFKVSSTNIQAL